MLMSFGVVPGCGEEVYGAARLPLKGLSLYLPRLIRKCGKRGMIARHKVNER